MEIIVLLIFKITGSDKKNEIKRDEEKSDTLLYVHGSIKGLSCDRYLNYKRDTL